MIFELWRRLVPEKQTVSLIADEVDYQISAYDLGELERMELLDVAFKIEKESQSAHRLIENILSSVAGKSSSHSYIRNSAGLNWSTRRNSVTAGVSVIASQNGIKKWGGKYKTTRDFKEINPFRH